MSGNLKHRKRKENVAQKPVREIKQDLKTKETQLGEETSSSSNPVAVYLRQSALDAL